MDYDDALRWLLTLPDFERTGEFASRPDVAPMVALLRELGDPHLGRATVHIAGSKGKGSTGAMVEAIVRASGLRTGYYISPHLHRYNERIRIDGEPIERDGFASAMTAVRAAIERVEPAFAGRRFIAFDALTAAAFVAFRDAAVNVQVIEVGLGGLLDSTNVFGDGGGQTAKGKGQTATSEGQATNGEGQTANGEGQTANSKQQTTLPHVVVLTPISLEHTDILGATIPAIAGQKAGIITHGSVVVAAPQRESALDVFHAACDERGATMIEVAKACQLSRLTATATGQKFRMKTARASYEATLPLAGQHQLENAATAIVASEELAAAMAAHALAKRDSGATDIAVEATAKTDEISGDSGEDRSKDLSVRELSVRGHAHTAVELTPAVVARGLAAVSWPGRLEVLTSKPRLIVDGAHNGDSAKRMAAALREYFGLRRAVFLFGTLAGKDVDGMVAAVAPMADAVFVTAWPSARAADPRDAAESFRRHDVMVSSHGALADAYDAALAQAGGGGAVVAFGSLAFVAAVREHVLGIESDAVRLGLGR
jgi:dihydrofolate synthase/folylpolyglutamate synthase